MLKSDIISQKNDIRSADPLFLPFILWAYNTIYVWSCFYGIFFLFVYQNFAEAICNIEKFSNFVFATLVIVVCKLLAFNILKTTIFPLIIKLSVTYILLNSL